MTNGDPTGTTVSRRRVLLGGAAVLAGTALSAMVGCTGPGSRPHPSASPAPAPPSPDELAAGRAALAARALLAGEAGLAAVAAPRLRAVVTSVATGHRAHLTALGLPDATPPPSGTASGSTAVASPATSSSESSSPAGTPSAGTLTAIAAVDAERTAAAEALADVISTTPGTAGLLARIAAARAVHADLIAAGAGLPTAGAGLPTAGAGLPAPAVPTGTPASNPTASEPGGSPTASATLHGDAAATLSALLAGEHAAVFGYGLIAARAAPDRKALARALWEAHRDRRDSLERRLVAAGRPLVAAEPCYDVGRPPTTPAQLASLAARVEDGLAAVALRAVTGPAADVRLEAATDLVQAARRAATWRGTAVPLPGDPPP